MTLRIQIRNHLKSLPLGEVQSATEIAHALKADSAQVSSVAGRMWLDWQVNRLRTVRRGKTVYLYFIDARI